MMAAFIQTAHGGARGAFRFGHTALIKKHTGASFIHLRYSANVFETGKNPACMVQVLVCFLAAVDLVKQEAKIVFNGCKVVSVLCLLKVITSGSVFDQRTVNVIAPLALGYILKSISERNVITTF